MRRRLASERGQSSPEYLGLILLLAALLAGAGALAGALPGQAVAKRVAGSLLCAVRGSERCAPASTELRGAYGGELAELIRTHAPEIRFEDAEFISLPVDFRNCRARACADSSEPGSLGRSFADQPATAFVRTIDCRGPQPPLDGAECGGARTGHLYLQYWLYYPDSATRPWGRRGYHLDDCRDKYL